MGHVGCRTLAGAGAGGTSLQAAPKEGSHRGVLECHNGAWEGTQWEHSRAAASEETGCASSPGPPGPPLQPALHGAGQPAMRKHLERPRHAAAR